MNPDVWYYADVQEATNSHEYTMSGGYETWTDLLPVRDWAAFETAWSTAYSARGGEVIDSDRYQSGNDNGNTNGSDDNENGNPTGGQNEPTPNDNGGNQNDGAQSNSDKQDATNLPADGSPNNYSNNGSPAVNNNNNI